MANKSKSHAQCLMLNVHVHCELPKKKQYQPRKSEKKKTENFTWSICCWRFYLNSALTPEVSMTKEVFFFLKKKSRLDQRHKHTIPKWKHKNSDTRKRILNQIENGNILKQIRKTQRNSKTKMFRAFQSEICINLDGRIESDGRMGGFWICMHWSNSVNRHFNFVFVNRKPKRFIPNAKLFLKPLNYVRFCLRYYPPARSSEKLNYITL